MLAIHNSQSGFHPRWIAYCDANGIQYKLVDCYGNDVIDQLRNCTGLMWHFHHANVRDILFAKQLLFAVQAMGKKVFPDFNTAWHFDDKVAQKYLLEGMGLNLVPSFVFYDKEKAMEWARTTSFPKVFKLRSGAGSQNVRLVKDFREARSLIQRAFARGFSQYDAWESLRERWRKHRIGQAAFYDVLKGLVRIAVPPRFTAIAGRERGYAYFQEYIPDNQYDLRVIVISGRAFAIKRMVRENDFRASGSGVIEYCRSNFPETVIAYSLEAASLLGSQCLAVDFVRRGEDWLIVEVSYGFAPEAYDKCEGYWDRDLHYHRGRFDPYGWMVEKMIPERSPDSL